MRSTFNSNVHMVQFVKIWRFVLSLTINSFQSISKTLGETCCYRSVWYSKHKSRCLAGTHTLHTIDTYQHLSINRYDIIYHMVRDEEPINTSIVYMKDHPGIKYDGKGNLKSRLLMSFANSICWTDLKRKLKWTENFFWQYYLVDRKTIHLDNMKIQNTSQTGRCLIHTTPGWKRKHTDIL